VDGIPELSVISELGYRMSEVGFPIPGTRIPDFRKRCMIGKNISDKPEMN
jgi:hypothetical protein